MTSTAEQSSPGIYYVPYVGTVLNNKIITNLSKNSMQGEAYKNGKPTSQRYILEWTSFNLENNQIIVKNFHIRGTDIKSSYKVNLVAVSDDLENKSFKGSCAYGKDLIIKSDSLSIPSGSIISAYISVIEINHDWIPYSGFLDMTSDVSVLELSNDDKNSFPEIDNDITIDYKTSSVGGKCYVTIIEMTNESGVITKKCKYYSGNKLPVDLNPTLQKDLVVKSSQLVSAEKKIPLIVWVNNSGSKQVVTNKGDTSEETNEYDDTTEDKKQKCDNDCDEEECNEEQQPNGEEEECNEEECNEEECNEEECNEEECNEEECNEEECNEEECNGEECKQVALPVVKNKFSGSCASNKCASVNQKKVTSVNFIPETISSEKYLKFSSLLYVRNTIPSPVKVYTLAGRNGSSLSFRGKFLKARTTGRITLFSFNESNPTSPSYKLFNTNAIIKRFPSGAFYYYTIENNNNLDPLKSSACKPITNENGGCTIEFNLDRSIQLTMWVRIN